ncbi:MAG: sulfurtransferase TusA family protein [Alphaproteobacteria bacterium]
MTDEINARGLSCPQPVLLATKKIKEGKVSEFSIVVDCGVSDENVERAAKHNGWNVKDKELKDDGAVKITLAKS